MSDRIDNSQRETDVIPSNPRTEETNNPLNHPSSLLAHTNDSPIPRAPLPAANDDSRTAAGTLLEPNTPPAGDRSVMENLNEIQREAIEDIVRHLKLLQDSSGLKHRFHLFMEKDNTPEHSGAIKVRTTTLFSPTISVKSGTESRRRKALNLIQSVNIASFHSDNEEQQTDNVVPATPRQPIRRSTGNVPRFLNPSDATEVANTDELARLDCEVPNWFPFNGSEYKSPPQHSDEMLDIPKNIADKFTSLDDANADILYRAFFSNLHQKAKNTREDYNQPGLKYSRCTPPWLRKHFLVGREVVSLGSVVVPGKKKSRNKAANHRKKLILAGFYHKEPCFGKTVLDHLINRLPVLRRAETQRKTLNAAALGSITLPITLNQSRLARIPPRESNSGRGTEAVNRNETTDGGTILRNDPTPISVNPNPQEPGSNGSSGASRPSAMRTASQREVAAGSNPSPSRDQSSGRQRQTGSQRQVSAVGRDVGVDRSEAALEERPQPARNRNRREERNEESGAEFSLDNEEHVQALQAAMNPPRHVPKDYTTKSREIEKYQRLYDQFKRQKDAGKTPDERIEAELQLLDAEFEREEAERQKAKKNEKRARVARSLFENLERKRHLDMLEETARRKRQKNSASTGMDSSSDTRRQVDEQGAIEREAQKDTEKSPDSSDIEDHIDIHVTDEEGGAGSDLTEILKHGPIKCGALMGCPWKLVEAMQCMEKIDGKCKKCGIPMHSKCVERKPLCNICIKKGIFESLHSD